MKIALYTVNVGGYDRPIEPPKIDGVDMFMFTDSPVDSESWTMKELPKVIENNRKTSRYPKINSHIVLPEYEYTIYIDSNMFINKHPLFFIDNFLRDNADIALHANPYRSCLYEEAKEIRDVLKYEKPEIVDKEINYIRGEGYPENNGLGACHLLVRRNTPNIERLNKVWWNMIEKYSYRDQLSFNYSCWKTENTYNVIEPYKKYTVQVNHAKNKVSYK